MSEPEISPMKAIPEDDDPSVKDNPVDADGPTSVEPQDLPEPDQENVPETVTRPTESTLTDDKQVTVPYSLIKDVLLFIQVGRGDQMDITHRLEAVK